MPPNYSHQYAQTNIQLYNQMLALSYSEADVDRVRQAYELLMQLFGSQYRPNGKPFVNHLIGTASILLTLGVKLTVVNAGLLHAAYSHGHFRHLVPYIPRLKRQRLRRVLGEEVESLIRAYQDLKWTPKTLIALTEQAHSMNSDTKNCVLIRLANELEDHLDAGLGYGAKSKRYYSDVDTIASLRQLSTALGCPEIVVQLEQCLEQQQAVDIPDVLIRSNTSSFQIPARPGTLLNKWVKVQMKKHGLRQ